MGNRALAEKLSDVYEELQSLWLVPSRHNIEILLKALCVVQEAHIAIQGEEKGEADVQADIE